MDMICEGVNGACYKDNQAYIFQTSATILMNVFLAVVHVYARKNITHMMHSSSKMKI
jgi:hypothetical protein